VYVKLGFEAAFSSVYLLTLTLDPKIGTSAVIAAVWGLPRSYPKSEGRKRLTPAVKAASTAMS
jgi:hypothetical protein